jgi:hypothetical protein
MVLRNDTNSLKDKLVFFVSMAELSGKDTVGLEAAVEVFMASSRNVSCHKKVKNLWVGDASGGNLCRLKSTKIAEHVSGLGTSSKMSSKAP